MSFEITTYGNPGADTLLIQLADEHDLEFIEQEVSHIRELTGNQDFCLKAIRVKSWNHDLSPWPAPAVFGNENFGDGAAETLQAVLSEALPPLASGQETSPGEALSASSSEAASAPRQILIGGYSLAGLFALWAGYQTDRFAGIAAASPSIWFPHFLDYMAENKLKARSVYLSLGDREEKTRNPVMSQVGKAIRDAEIILKEAGTDCILEWNKGNHFREPDLRTAKAFAWLMKGIVE